MLTALKKTDAASFLNEVSSVPLQDSIRNLDRAYGNFFKNRSRHPVFKRRSGQQSAGFSRNAFCYRKEFLSLAKIGPLKIRWSREIPDGIKPSSAVVTMTSSGKYFVTLTLDLPNPEPLPPTGQSVGVDLGIRCLATLSTSETIANPKRTFRHAKQMARLQRSLCRRQRSQGQPPSKRYLRIKARIAKLHERIADARKDTLDKLTTRLVRENDTICIEDLNVRGMLKNHKLARAISDAGFGMFRRMLEYKAKKYGRTVVVLPRFFPSSQLCSSCGHRYSDLKLRESRWTCTGCGETHDRDVNAAKNLLQAAENAVSARGGEVRPVKPKASAKGKTGTPRRTANRPRRKV